jgi:hypothetical protein
VKKKVILEEVALFLTEQDTILQFPEEFLYDLTAIKKKLVKKSEITLT